MALKHNTKLNSRIAEQIVDTVKEFSGHDVNFITPDGIILASTNKDRIGDYHEIGHQVAQSGQALEVAFDDSFYGTKMGVNLPFYWHGELVCIIGISGNPDEVRNYAVLAERITRLIILEQEVEAKNRNEAQETNYIVNALVNGSLTNTNYIIDFLRSHSIDETTLFRTIVIEINSRYNPANLSMLDQRINGVFSLTESPLFSFTYPNRYYILLSEKQYIKSEYAFKKLAGEYSEIMCIGAGSLEKIEHQSLSREAAELATKTIASKLESINTPGFMLYDNLTIEILTGSIPENIRMKFISKTTASLSEKETMILKSYFKNDMSLKKTSEELYIHKNTLQYQLDKIAEKTGKNPRTTAGAVALYLGMMLI